MCVGCVDVVINSSSRCAQSFVNEEIVSPEVNMQAL